MRKALKTITILTVMLTMLSTTAFAYIPDEWDYNQSSKTYSKNITYSHEHTNVSTGWDSVELNLSRTKSSSISVCAGVTKNLVVAEANLGLEVAFGQSTTISTWIHWGLQPRSITRIEYGSKLVSVKGTEYYYKNGVLAGTKGVTAKYSYTTYSSNIPSPL